MDDFVLEGEFGSVAVIEVEEGVLLGIEKSMLALDLDELLATGEELSDALLPLSTIAHLIVLVDFLEDGVPV